MTIGAHEGYLQQLKDFLRQARLPGDKAKLVQILGWLKKLDVPIEETERGELRLLLATTFAMPEAELEAYVPRPEQVFPSFRKERSERPGVGGFLDHYLEVTAGQESPDEFHAFALLTCMGAALGRRVWIDMTWFKVWPNMSVVLTGPAGGPKKTTAWDMALDTVRGVFREWKVKPITDASPAALVEDLARGGRDAVGFIYAPEFRLFFPSQNYMEGAIPLITRLLDNPDHYNPSRITRRAASLRNVALSMAGGSTLDWMAKLPEDAQGGGFLTRVMVVHAEKGKSAKALPKRAVSLSAAKVLSALGDVNQYARGAVQLDPRAKEWYQKWYEGVKEMKSVSPRLILYYNRRQIHLLRVAMLMTLPRRTIRREDLERADTLLKWVEEPLPDVYRIIGMSKSGEATRAVLEVLRTMGGQVGWATLMKERKGRLNAKDLRLAVDTLKQAGQLEESDNAIEHSVRVRDLGMVE